MNAVLSGLSFLTPSAWWALLTLVIPLLIHLFNRSRGRLVHIGHIDLIRQARKAHVTEVKLAQWLLLLLRLSIFTLAALILLGLAKPGLSSSDTVTIYLAPAWLKTAPGTDIEKVLADANSKSGSRIFLLQEGFPQLAQGRLDAMRSDRSLGSEEITDIWPMLSERLSLEQHLGPVTVYATDYALQYGFHSPALPREVLWHISHPQSAPVVSRRPLQVLVAHDPDHAAEAKQFGAILSTLRKHRLPGLTWTMADSAILNKEQWSADWLILLSDSGLDPSHLDHINSSVVILTDAVGTDAENTRKYMNLPFYPFSSFTLDRYTNNTHAANPEAVNARIVLSTADGIPLLEETQVGRVRILQFNSRFDPQWSSITRLPEFPELFLQLMLGHNHPSPRYADARISPARLDTTKGNSDSRPPLPRRSIQGILALILVFLWIAERWLSERKPRENR